MHNLNWRPPDFPTIERWVTNWTKEPILAGTRIFRIVTLPDVAWVFSFEGPARADTGELLGGVTLDEWARLRGARWKRDSSSLSVSEFGKSSGAPKDEFHTDDASIPTCIVGADWMSFAI
ncbi:hypothetical protein B0H14DRAFT_2579878 [Mycena olivaceomarginata]|nr:hypothetical protein B0H14DRAFT_2579878 [Mycena olivaceomarginata]